MDTKPKTQNRIVMKLYASNIRIHMHAQASYRAKFVSRNMCGMETRLRSVVGKTKRI